MTPRVWDAFLTEQDKAPSHLLPTRAGFVHKPARLSCPDIPKGFRRKPEPLLEPSALAASTGLAGWEPPNDLDPA